MTTPAIELKIPLSHSLAFLNSTDSLLKDPCEIIYRAFTHIVGRTSNISNYIQPCQMTIMPLVNFAKQCFTEKG